MPSNRKFHKMVLKVTVLSEKPFTGEEGLEALAQEMDQGDDAGTCEVTENIMISSGQAVRELKAIGSEPGFFQLTETGEDAKE